MQENNIIETIDNGEIQDIDSDQSVNDVNENSLTTILIPALILAIIVGILKRWITKYSEIIFKYFKNIFFRISFPRRSSCFPCVAHLHHYKSTPYQYLNEDNYSNFSHFSFPSVVGSAKRRKQTQTIKTGFRKEITEYFDTAICGFNLNVRSDLFNDGVKVIHTVEHLTKELIIPALKSETPQLIVVEGSVGCGKTTLLGNLSFYIGGAPYENEITIVTITLNVRKDFKEVFNQDIDSNTNVEELLEKIDENIARKVKYLLTSKALITISNDTNTLKEVIEKCYGSHITPIIIFDELDFLYYDFCMKATIPDEKILIPAIVSIYNKIVTHFIQLPSRIEVNRGKFNNSLFILSLRTSSIRIFDEIRGNVSRFDPSGMFLPADIVHQVFIEDQDSQKINEIICGRLKYMHKKLIKIKNKSIEDIESIKNITALLKEFDANQINYETNIKISVHGMRHIMKIISKIDTEDSSSLLMRNLIPNPNLLRLYQYIDGCHEYSQVKEGISNMFLINKDAKNNQINNDPDYKIKYDESFFKDHLQTYWLKYLIVQYIHQKHNNDQEVTKSEVLATFCDGREGSSKTYYERALVLLILLHASEVDHGRLIKFKYCPSSTSIKINRSNRLKELLNKNIIWTFGYFMVIIEDSWMGVPNKLHDDFKIIKPSQRTHHFITKFYQLPESEKYRFVKYKTRLVLLFCGILKYSFLCEEKRYKEVFLELRKQGMLINSSEDVEDNIKYLKQSILEFTTSYISKEYSSQLSEYIDGEFNDEYEKKRKYIKKAFDQYQGKTSIFSIEKKMDNYHKKNYRI